MILAHVADMIELVMHVVELLFPLLICLAHEVVEACFLIKFLLRQVLWLIYAATCTNIRNLSLAEFGKQLRGCLRLRVLRPPIIFLFLLRWSQVLFEALLALCRFFAKLLGQRSDQTLRD